MTTSKRSFVRSNRYVPKLDGSGMNIFVSKVDTETGEVMYRRKLSYTEVRRMLWNKKVNLP